MASVIFFKSFFFSSLQFTCSFGLCLLVEWTHSCSDIWTWLTSADATVRPSRPFTACPNLPVQSVQVKLKTTDTWCHNVFDPRTRRLGFSPTWWWCWWACQLWRWCSGVKQVLLWPNVVISCWWFVLKPWAVESPQAAHRVPRVNSLSNWSKSQPLTFYSPQIVQVQNKSLAFSSSVEDGHFPLSLWMGSSASQLRSMELLI